MYQTKPTFPTCVSGSNHIRRRHYLHLPQIYLYAVNVCESLYISDCHLEVIVAPHSNTDVKCFSLVKGKVPHVHRVGTAAVLQPILGLNTYSISIYSTQPSQPLSNSVIIQTAGHRVCEWDL